MKNLQNGIHSPWHYSPSFEIVPPFGWVVQMRNEKLVAFGKRVRELRKNKGLSQDGFAVLSGIDRSYMGQVERGEKNVTLIKIYQLSEALGVEVADLFPRVDG
ncbi:helix-turn-helix domain-containing protein [Halomonas gemina]